MTYRIALIGCGVAGLIACQRTEAASPSPAPVEKASPARSLGPPVKTAPAPVSPETKASGQVPLAPFTNGKRVRISHLVEIEPLEITVPKGVKMEKRYMNGEGIAPRAGLVGGALNLEVMEPEAGFRDIAWYKAQTSSDEKVIRAEETADGFLWLDAIHGEFSELVSRPKLKVICVQSQMKTLADAELAAAVCLSLRAAK
jgi:hypothetical protein